MLAYTPWHPDRVYINELAGIRLTFLEDLPDPEYCIIPYLPPDELLSPVYLLRCGTAHVFELLNYYERVTSLRQDGHLVVCLWRISKIPSHVFCRLTPSQLNRMAHNLPFNPPLCRIGASLLFDQRIDLDAVIRAYIGNEIDNMANGQSYSAQYSYLVGQQKHIPPLDMFMLLNKHELFSEQMSRDTIQNYIYLLEQSLSLLAAQASANKEALCANTDLLIKAESALEFLHKKNAAMNE